MFKQIDYTMVIVSDMNRSVEFYQDKLGIPLKFQSPDWPADVSPSASQLR